MMGWIKAIASEFLGLFVDDVGFALAILVWVLLGVLVLPRLGLPGAVPAIVLTLGLIGILAESTLRRSRKR